MGHGKKLRRLRNALKVYAPAANIAAVVLAMPDEEASDGLSLGPLTEEMPPPNLTTDISGTSSLNQQQYSQLVTLISNFSEIFMDNPGVSSLPAYQDQHSLSAGNSTGQRSTGSQRLKLRYNNYYLLESLDHPLCLGQAQL